jgi:hypothetical protein
VIVPEAVSQLKFLLCRQLWARLSPFQRRISRAMSFDDLRSRQILRCACYGERFA